MKNRIAVTSCIAFLAMLFSTFDANARLGENKEQILKRYGEPVERSPGLNERHETLLFHKSGFYIMVEILDGKSQQEIYKTISGQTITKKETETLLEVNSMGQEWRHKAGNDTVKVYLYEIKDLMTAFHKGNVFAVKTNLYAEFEETEKARAKQENLEDF